MDRTKMGFKESTGLVMAMTIVLGWTYWSYVFFYNTLFWEYLVVGMFVLAFIPQMRDIIGTARVTVLHTPTDVVWKTGLQLMPTPFPFFHTQRVEVPFGLILEKEYYPETNPQSERITNSTSGSGNIIPLNLARDPNEKVLLLNTGAKLLNNMSINPNEVRLKFVKMYYWLLPIYLAVAVPSKILANNFEGFSSYTFTKSEVGKCVTLPKGEKIELTMKSYPKSWTINGDTKIFSINEHKFWMIRPGWDLFLQLIPKTENGYEYDHPIKIVLPDGEGKQVCF